jgi:serine/threonine protein kinase
LHGAEKPVIYRDFKTSNVLLDSVSTDSVKKSLVCQSVLTVRSLKISYFNHIYLKCHINDGLSIVISWHYKKIYTYGAWKLISQVKWWNNIGFIMHKKVNSPIIFMHYVVLFEIGLHSKIVRFWTCKNGARGIKVTCYNKSYGHLWICSPRIHLNR